MASVGQLDRRHEELVEGLEGLAGKPAAIRLLDYLKTLPAVAENPHALFYHVDAVRRLRCLILEPAPFSTHPKFLHDLITLLQAAEDSPVARRVGSLAEAKTRLRLLMCAEYGVRTGWERAVEAAREAGISLPDPTGRDGVERVGEVLSVLRIHQSARGLLWPYHFLDPKDLPAHAVLGVLVDGEDVPAPYREAYLCAVGTRVRLSRQREALGPVVRARNDRGEDLPLSDELKDVVREAVARSFVLLGPVAQRKLHVLRAEIDVSIRRPTIVTQLAGRSILLPLILSLSRRLSEELNLPGIPVPRFGVVWTGDVDKHGSVRHVEHIDEKTARVFASRVESFAYAAEDDQAVTATVGTPNSGRALERFPVAHVQDCVGNPDLVAIRTRGPAARALRVARRRTKPLGLTGTALVTAALIALGFSVPRLASWFDTTIVEARITDDHRHMEVLNSRNRTVRRFVIEPTFYAKALLADLDRDGRPEILYGSSSRDPTPGVLFCLDAGGRELWRFKGGFRSDEPRPYDVANTFDYIGALASDLDGDGHTEVVAAFRHNPWSPSQLALLTSEGHHIGTFWNHGHLSAGTATPELTAFAARDIDSDGYVEILAGGTNNRCNRATLLVLDPRSFEGTGPSCDADVTQPTWQSYVLFPGCAEIERIAGIPRLYAAWIAFKDPEGKQAVTVGVHGQIPGKSAERSGYFRYVLDTNLNVVDFYWPDGFASWIRKARADGEHDVDITAPEFSERMRQIEILPGPPELLKP